jgi:hypothetical protein
MDLSSSSVLRRIRHRITDVFVGFNDDVNATLPLRLRSSDGR